MIHQLLTIAVYPPELSADVNAQRLAITAATSVPSVAAQTARVDEWVVAVHPEDPRRAERLEVFAGGGVPVTVAEYSAALPVSEVAESVAPAARRRVLSDSPAVDPWLEVFYRAGALFEPYLPGGDVLVTRLDDDDAFTRDAIGRVRTAAESAGPGRRGWVFPEGYQLSDGGGSWRAYRHESNQFVTHQLRGGDRRDRHPFAINHNRLRDHFEDVRFVDGWPAWGWFRHGLNVSRIRDYSDWSPTTGGIRGAFGVEWDDLREVTR